MWFWTPKGQSFFPIPACCFIASITPNHAPFFSFHANQEQGSNLQGIHNNMASFCQIKIWDKLTLIKRMHLQRCLPTVKRQLATSLSPYCLHPSLSSPLDSAERPLQWQTAQETSGQEGGNGFCRAPWTADWICPSHTSYGKPGLKNLSYLLGASEGGMGSQAFIKASCYGLVYSMILKAVGFLVHRFLWQYSASVGQRITFWEVKRKPDVCLKLATSLILVSWCRDSISRCRVQGKMNHLWDNRADEKALCSELSSWGTPSVN